MVPKDLVCFMERNFEGPPCFQSIVAGVTQTLGGGEPATSCLLIILLLTKHPRDARIQFGWNSGVVLICNHMGYSGRLEACVSMFGTGLLVKVPDCFHHKVNLFRFYELVYRQRNQVRSLPLCNRKSSD